MSLETSFKPPLDAPEIEIGHSQTYANAASKNVCLEAAGRHFIVDFWGCDQLDDCALMEAAMRQAAKLANATLLHVHLHRFTEGGGVTGVALLAESHISVHTWPERHYAAFDVFMCGDSKPELAVEHLKSVFMPERVELQEIARGS